jgi:hypothetical protein
VLIKARLLPGEDDTAAFGHLRNYRQGQKALAAAGKHPADARLHELRKGVKERWCAARARGRSGRRTNLAISIGLTK